MEMRKKQRNVGGGNIVKIEKDEDKECKNFDVIFAEDALGLYERGQRKRKANVLLNSPDFVATNEEIANLRNVKSARKVKVKKETKCLKYQGVRISMIVLKQNKPALYERFMTKIKGDLRVDLLNEIAFNEVLQRPGREAPVSICRRRQVARTKKKLRLCRREDDPYPSPPRLEPSALIYRDYVEEQPPVLQPAMLDVERGDLNPQGPISFSGRCRRRNKRFGKYSLSRKRKVAKVTPMQSRSEVSMKDKVDDRSREARGQSMPTLQSLLVDHRIQKAPGWLMPRSKSPKSSLVAASDPVATPAIGAAVGSSEFTAAVNKLARKENTKKFFQLKVGEKIVLIPTDGHSVMPKAFVLDASRKPATQLKDKSVTDKSAQNTNVSHSSPTSTHEPTPSNETTFTPLVPKQEPMDYSDIPSLDVPTFSETHSPSFEMPSFSKTHLQEKLKNEQMCINAANVPVVNRKSEKVVTVSAPEPKIYPSSTQTTHTCTSYPVSYRSILPRFPPPYSEFDSPKESNPIDMERSRSIVQKAIAQQTIAPRTPKTISQEALKTIAQQAVALQTQKTIAQQTQKTAAQQTQKTQPVKKLYLRGLPNEKGGKLGTIIVRTSPSKAAGATGTSDKVKESIKFLKFNTSMPSAKPPTKLISIDSLPSAHISPSSLVSVAPSLPASRTVMSPTTLFPKLSTVLSTATSSPASNTVVLSAASFTPSNTAVPAMTPLLSSNTVASPTVSLSTPTTSVTPGNTLRDATYAYFILPSSQENQQPLIVYTNTSDPLNVPSAIPNPLPAVSACSPSILSSAQDSARSLLKKTATSTVTSGYTISPTPTASHTLVKSDSKSIVTVYPPAALITTVLTAPTATAECQANANNEHFVASNALKCLSQMKKPETKHEAHRTERLIVNMPFTSHKTVGLKSKSESSDNSLSAQLESSTESASLSQDYFCNPSNQVRIKQEPEEADSYVDSMSAQAEEDTYPERDAVSAQTETQAEEDASLEQDATSAQTETQAEEDAIFEQDATSAQTEAEMKGNVQQESEQNDAPDNNSDTESESETKCRKSSDTESEEETISGSHLSYENVTLDNGSTATIVTETVPANENDMDEKIRKLKEMLRIQREKVEKLRQSKLISEEDKSD